MTHEPFNPCLLLWADHEEDISLARREAGEFLAFRQSRQPGLHADQDWRLIGIWVDPLAAAISLLSRASHCKRCIPA